MKKKINFFIHKNGGDSLNIDSTTNKQIYSQPQGAKVKEKGLVSSQTSSFDTVVQQTRPQEVDEKLTNMIDTIDKLKATLEYDMSVDNLMAYKGALKSFVDYYSKNELEVQDVLMTDRRGNTKKLQVVKTLNEKLNSLTSTMLETHLGHMKTLKEIGEIQGLVVNLYL
ncbi:hypothetical protein CN918_27600 [Priestia megaterium]|nr:hypothetical protein CN918_27600 [Priestia megaterium]